jgi:hypothetical protein
MMGALVFLVLVVVLGRGPRPPGRWYGYVASYWWCS